MIKQSVLVRARELIKLSWAQGSRTALPKLPVGQFHKPQYCPVEAIGRALDEDAGQYSHEVANYSVDECVEYVRTIRKLAAAQGYSIPKNFLSVEDWNDNPGRKRDEVVKLFDLAIKENSISV